jgi:hypothetical protein
LRNFRTIPIDARAEQFFKDGDVKIDCICENVHLEAPGQPYINGNPHIHTLEGTIFVEEGDFVVEAISDRFMVYSPELFEKIYTEVVDKPLELVKE